jgi:4a-hydroxytetrahydrobiopterin dehydratase
MENYTAETASTKMRNLKGWTFSNNCLVKEFKFKDFREAMSFMVRVSYFCEEKNHHPEWTNVYNKVSIRLSTHDAGGVTDKDFELASLIDSII